MDIFVASLKPVEKIFVVKHLTMLIKVGMTMPAAISVIAEQASSKAAKKIFTDIAQKVAAASTLGEAMQPYEKQFGKFFIKAIQIGEEKGTLELNLEQLERKMTRDFDFKEKVKTAMFYPAFLGIIMFGMALIIYFFVLPNLTKLFSNIKTELPFATKLLIALSDNAGIVGPTLLGIAIVSIIIFVNLKRLSKVAYMLDILVLKIPIFGSIVYQLQLSDFHQNLGVMITIGESLSETFSTVAYVSTNRVFQKELLQTAELLKTGNMLSDVFDGKARFLPIFSQRMLALAEKSGTIADTSFSIANFYDAEVDRTLSRLTTMLEPFMLVIIGSAIAFVAFAILTPIYDITGITGGI